MILTGNNTYSGSTTVSAGILQVGNGTSTTAGINSTSGVAIASGAVFRLEPGANTIFSKLIGGDGRLEYKGGTTINGGNLYLGGTTATATGTAGTGNIVLNNGWLYFRRSNNYTYSGEISGTGNVTITEENTGIITLNGNNSYTVPTYIGGGKLALGTNGKIESSSLVSIINNNAKFDISAGNKKIKDLSQPRDN